MCTNMSQFDPINMETTKIAEDTSSIPHLVLHCSAANVPITHEDDQERSAPESGEKQESDSTQECPDTSVSSESNSDHPDNVKPDDIKHNAIPQVATPPPQGDQPNLGQMPFPYAMPYGYYFPPPMYGQPYFGGQYMNPTNGMPMMPGLSAGTNIPNSNGTSNQLTLNPLMFFAEDEFRCTFMSINCKPNEPPRFIVIKKLKSKERYLLFIKEMIEVFKSNDMTNLIPSTKGVLSSDLSKTEKEYLEYIHSKCVPKEFRPDWFVDNQKHGAGEAIMIQQAMIKALKTTGPANAVIKIGKFRFRQNVPAPILHAEAKELIEEALKAEDLQECLQKALVLSVLQSLPEKHKHLVVSFESKHDYTIEELFEFLGSHISP